MREFKSEKEAKEFLKSFQMEEISKNIFEPGEDYILDIGETAMPKYEIKKIRKRKYRIRCTFYGRYAYLNGDI